MSRDTLQLQQHSTWICVCVWVCMLSKQSDTLCMECPKDKWSICYLNPREIILEPLTLAFLLVQHFLRQMSDCSTVKYLKAKWRKLNCNIYDTIVYFCLLNRYQSDTFNTAPRPHKGEWIPYFYCNSKLVNSMKWGNIRRWRRNTCLSHSAYHYFCLQLCSICHTWHALETKKDWLNLLFVALINVRKCFAVAEAFNLN